MIWYNEAKSIVLIGNDLEKGFAELVFISMAADDEYKLTTGQIFKVPKEYQQKPESFLMVNTTIDVR